MALPHASSHHVLIKRLFCAVAVSSTTAVAFLQSPPPSHGAAEHKHSSNSAACLSRTTALYDHNNKFALENDNAIPKAEAALLTQHYQPMEIPTRAAKCHAIFGALLGNTMIERYQVWKQRNNNNNNDKDDSLLLDETNVIVIAHVQLGNAVNGHPGVVHGGILSLLLDDVFGFAYEALGDVPLAVTANLSIDYCAPVPADTMVRVAVQMPKPRQGRKLYWQAQMTSIDQSVLYAQATSLYIIPRWVIETEEQQHQ